MRDRFFMDECGKLFGSARDFALHLKTLRMSRLAGKVMSDSKKRLALTPLQRREVFEKTGGHCHLCGGFMEGHWVIDHVMPHARGGAAGMENCLPAHEICNRARWFYGAEEFQLIVKLGAWFRTQIEEIGDPDALQLSEKFVSHYNRRESRKKCARARGKRVRESSFSPSPTMAL